MPTREAKPIIALFKIKPYIPDTYHERAIYFAQHGYAFVLVGCRRIGNKGSDFERFVNEGRDVYDIVEWLTTRLWCNKPVSKRGGYRRN